VNRVGNVYLTWYTDLVSKGSKPFTKMTHGSATPESKGKRVPAIFYRTEAGGEPVREWLRKLPPEDRKHFGEDIKTVEFGWPVGMPVCKPIGRGHL